MEYAAGGDLSDCLRRRRKSGEVFSQSKRSCRGLCRYVWASSTTTIARCCRDLKPQNIFLTSNGKIKIGDLVLPRCSTARESSRKRPSALHYISGNMQEKRYNHKSDVWSLGCILYEMATLKHAFDGRNMKILVMKIVRGKHGQLPAIQFRGT